MRLFDTAGAERYQRSAVTSNYFRDSDAALLMYSVADSNTFENLTEWIELAKRYVEHYKSERFVWCFVGNKTDQERSVSIDRVQYSCQQLKTSLNFTTCARNGTNVMDALKATVASVHSMWIDNKCCEETRRSAPSVRISSTQQSPPHTSSRCPCPR